MNLSAVTRVGTYGVIGGLFWAIQIAALLLFLWADLSLPVEAGWSGWVDRLGHFISELPKELQPAASGLLVALVVVAIFTTGLVLDLVGSTYALLEMEIFKENIDENRDWLDHVVFRHAARAEVQYHTLISKLIRTRDEQRPTHKLKTFAYLKPSMLKKNSKRLLRRYNRRKELIVLLPHYHKLRSFLYWYALTSSEALNSDQLAEEVRLWRITRAITTAVRLAVVEGVAMFIYSLWVHIYPIFPLAWAVLRAEGVGNAILALISVQLAVVLVLLLFLLIFVPWVAYLYYSVAAPALAKLAYGGICLSLFDLAYFAAVKSGEEKPPEGIMKYDYNFPD